MLPHPCSATKPQGQVRFWLRAGAPLQTPSSLPFSGHIAPRDGVARTNLVLVPILYAPPLCLALACPDWPGDGQRQGPHGPIPHGSAPGLLSVLGAASPARLAPCRDSTAVARGRSSPYGAPGRLPALGQVLSSGLHKTLLLAPAGFPSPGRDPRQPPPLASPQHRQENGSAWPDTDPPPQCSPWRMLSKQPTSPCGPLHLQPSRAALLGGFCQPAAKVLMVLCLALNYFPNCHSHALASGAGCDPTEPDSPAAAWGANGRSTPHVEFNYWLSSLTEYIG